MLISDSRLSTSLGVRIVRETVLIATAARVSCEICQNVLVESGKRHW